MSPETTRVGDVLETVVTDADIARVSEEPVAESTGNPGYSNAIMKLFKHLPRTIQNDTHNTRI